MGVAIKTLGAWWVIDSDAWKRGPKVGRWTRGRRSSSRASVAVVDGGDGDA